MNTYIRQTRIEWGDCDPAGIVFYPRYFALFDSCTNALFADALGMSKYDAIRHYGGANYPMVDTHGRFLKPLKFGDDVTIETTITAIRRSSFDVRHRITFAGELCVECLDTRVWSRRDPHDETKLRSMPVPDDIRAKLGFPALP